MTPAFKNSELYSCQDSEFVTHRGWGDAILEHFEEAWEEGDETITQQCERIGPVTVTSYNPGKVLPTWVAGRVETLLERFREDFEEQYGCEDFPAEPWNDETAAWAKNVITANLLKSLRSAKTYTVHTTGTHTFSVAECIEMLKE